MTELWISWSRSGRNRHKHTWTHPGYNVLFGLCGHDAWGHVAPKKHFLKSCCCLFLPSVCVCVKWYPILSNHSSSHNHASWKWVPPRIVSFRIGSFSTSMIMRRKGKMAINVFGIASICHYPESKLGRQTAATSPGNCNVQWPKPPSSEHQGDCTDHEYPSGQGMHAVKHLIASIGWYPFEPLLIMKTLYQFRWLKPL